MSYLKINKDGSITYPYTIDELKKTYLNTSFPNDIDNSLLQSLNIYMVNKVSHSQDPYTIYTQSTPVLIEGLWYENWIETPMNIVQIEMVNSAQWEVIKKQRNQYLLQSDWTQLSDSPLSNEKKQEWINYRQALRDITTQEDPFNITWPTKPE